MNRVSPSRCASSSAFHHASGSEHLLRIHLVRTNRMGVDQIGTLDLQFVKVRPQQLERFLSVRFPALGNHESFVAASLQYVAERGLGDPVACESRRGIHVVGTDVKAIRKEISGFFPRSMAGRRRADTKDRDFDAGLAKFSTRQRRQPIIRLQRNSLPGRGNRGSRTGRAKKAAPRCFRRMFRIAHGCAPGTASVDVPSAPLLWHRGGSRMIPNSAVRWLARIEIALQPKLQRTTTRPFLPRWLNAIA